MKLFKYGLAVILSVCMFNHAFAKSPIGHWITIDDKTGEKRAEVDLTLRDGVLNGKIIEVYPQVGDTGICSKCPDEFKNKPIQGLEFIWGLKDKGHNIWDGGHILDPKTGKIYRAKMTVKNNKLYIRGYVGVSLLGRTQIWIRA